MTTTTICDSDVEVKLVENVLQKYFKTSSELQKCQGSVISKGMGFTSEVMRLVLKWSPDDPELPQTVILKAPATKCLEEILKNIVLHEVNNNNDKKIIKPPSDFDPKKMMLVIHKAEYDAYTVLTQVNPSPVPIPTIYGMKESDPAMILMQDLGTKAKKRADVLNYQIGHQNVWVNTKEELMLGIIIKRATLIDNIATGLDLEQWKSVTDALANLHGWSLTTDYPWRQKIAAQDKLIELFKTWIESMELNLKVVARKFEAELGPIDTELIAKAISMDTLVNAYERYKHILPDVMQHGDTWINNIMFEKDPETGAASSKIAAFIDWQISFQGCGVNDLARVNSWCVDPDLRDLYEKEMIWRYYDRLCEICEQREGLLDKKLVTFDKVWRVYSHACALNGLMGISMTDFLLQFIAKVDEDPSGWRRRRMLFRLKWAYEKAEHFFRDVYDEAEYW